MREIIESLERESAVAPEEIATRSHMPASQVAEYLEQAQERGVLLRYSALVNWEKSDTDKIFAFIAEEATPEHGVGFDEIANYISQFNEAPSVYLMSGTSDLTVEGEDFREIARFVAEKLTPTPGVRATATPFVLKTCKMEGAIVSEELKNHRLAVSP